MHKTLPRKVRLELKASTPNEYLAVQYRHDLRHFYVISYRSYLTSIQTWKCVRHSQSPCRSRISVICKTKYKSSKQETLFCKSLQNERHIYAKVFKTRDTSLQKSSKQETLLCKSLQNKRHFFAKVFETRDTSLQSLRNKRHFFAKVFETRDTSLQSLRNKRHFFAKVFKTRDAFQVFKTRDASLQKSSKQDTYLQKSLKQETHFCKSLHNKRHISAKVFKTRDTFFLIRSNSLHDFLSIWIGHELVLWLFSFYSCFVWISTGAKLYKFIYYRSHQFTLEVQFTNHCMTWIMNIVYFVRINILSCFVIIAKCNCYTWMTRINK